MPVLINNGCPNGIKDNIAPIKTVLFFITKLLSINISTIEKIDFIRFLEREGEKIQRQKPLLFIAQKHCYDINSFSTTSHVKP